MHSWSRSGFLISLCIFPAQIILTLGVLAEEIESTETAPSPPIDITDTQSPEAAEGKTEQPGQPSQPTSGTNAAKSSDSLSGLEAPSSEPESTLEVDSKEFKSTSHDDPKNIPPAIQEAEQNLADPKAPQKPLAKAAQKLSAPRFVKSAGEIAQPNLPDWAKQLKIDSSSLPQKPLKPAAKHVELNQSELTISPNERPLIRPLTAKTSSDSHESGVNLLIQNLRNISEPQINTPASSDQDSPSLRNPRRVPESDSIAWNLRKLESYPQGKPANGFVFISSLFGQRRNPFGRGIEFHNGVDLVGAKGIPILATAGGKVSRRKGSRAYGKHVILEHEFGYQTLYAHLSRINVKPNQIVERGDIIGFLGSTGRSTGPHLHYSVYVNQQAVDPKPYIFD